MLIWSEIDNKQNWQGPIVDKPRNILSQFSQQQQQQRKDMHESDILTSPFS